MSSEEQNGTTSELVHCDVFSSRDEPNGNRVQVVRNYGGMNQGLSLFTK